MSKKEMDMRYCLRGRRRARIERIAGVCIITTASNTIIVDYSRQAKETQHHFGNLWEAMGQHFFI
jgi:phage-related minor tail protein